MRCKGINWANCVDNLYLLWKEEKTAPDKHPHLSEPSNHCTRLGLAWTWGYEKPIHWHRSMENIAKAATRLKSLWYFIPFSQAKLCLSPPTGGVFSLLTSLAMVGFSQLKISHSLIEQMFIENVLCDRKLWYEGNMEILGLAYSERRQDNKQRRKERKGRGAVFIYCVK